MKVIYRKNVYQQVLEIIATESSDKKIDSIEVSALEMDELRQSPIGTQVVVNSGIRSVRVSGVLVVEVL